ncbi:MAG: hypothetical protein E7058_08355 [Lentisphaerae bacterium]|nr:hypothetical protein [Lentisphaerota bacterium]
MIEFSCPCCNERYQLDGDALPDGMKFECGKCGKKVIHKGNKLIIFAFEVSRGEQSHIAACPHCSIRYEFPYDSTGICQCPNCSGDFFIHRKLPTLPAAPATAEPVPQQQIAEESCATAGEYVNDAASAESYATEVNYSNGNPVLNFNHTSTGQPVMQNIQPLNFKVGMPREKSGLSGFFISIAEKLCRN